MKKNETMNPPIEATGVATTTTYTDVAFAKEAEKHYKLIKAELKKIESSFEKIAFALHWFYRTNAFEQLGYKTISEFALVEYGIKKSTTYNYIDIVNRFAKRDEKGEIIDCICDEFADFKSSKLIALLDVPEDEQLKEFTPDMSVREIAKKVKEMNSEGTSGSISGSEESEEDVFDTTATEINRQEVICFSDLEEYNKYLDGMNDLIEKNLKSKAFKDGKHKIEISVVW